MNATTHARSENQHLQENGQQLLWVGTTGQSSWRTSQSSWWVCFLWQLMSTYNCQEWSFINQLKSPSLSKVYTSSSDHEVQCFLQCSSYTCFQELSAIHSKATPSRAQCFTVMKDVWITLSDGSQLPCWLEDIDICNGIWALHKLDWCKEEWWRLSMKSENMCCWFGYKLMSIEVTLQISECKSFLSERVMLSTFRCINFHHTWATTLLITQSETQMEQVHDTTYLVWPASQWCC